MKSALDAHYIPRVSNDTRENHRQSALTRLTKVGEGGERGAGADNERSEQSAIRGRARARSLITRDGWPGPGMGRCARRPGRFSPIIVVM